MSDRLTVLVRHQRTEWPLAEVPVEAVLVDTDAPRAVASARTAADGTAELVVEDEQWRRRARCGDHDRLAVRVGGGPAVPLGPATLAEDAFAELKVPPADQVGDEARALVAEHVVAARRAQLGDLAADLASPRADSVVRVVAASERARLLDELLDASAAHDDGTLSAGERLRGEPRLVDPDALREGRVHLVPWPELEPEPDLLDLADNAPRPSPWERLPWWVPNDLAYRDYLRGVFVLFAHQQAKGAWAEPTAFPAVAEQQLRRRFFQDFRTADRTETPLNRLLIPIVSAILTAPTGSGFGFGIPAASLPAQGELTDREQLDALLALAPVVRAELANRYRLPLSEPDSALSTPVQLNIHTLSRVLSDTAQGPVEPPENQIEPQLPGAEGKPILWREVVGSAPFFLRFEEWLDRQQPFFPENLFAIRTQVASTGPSGLWLDQPRKTFLEFHKAIPVTHAISSYKPYFRSISEVQRAATFLLAYGVADAKLVELVRAIDKSQFATAIRLADEAQTLLDAARPTPVEGENWEPDRSSGNFPRPLSMALRRQLKVSTITELTGTTRTYLPDGFERYFELARPTHVWEDVVQFRIALETATRLREYQLRFVLPMLRATIHAGLGDILAAIDTLARVTGFYVGMATLGTPAGMVRHPDASQAKRVVAGRLRWGDPLGDRPYTARLMHDDLGRLDGPYTLTPQTTRYEDLLSPEPAFLHRLEVSYARLVQADALLAWAEALYRTDEAANLERARELYKAVVFLHGEDPGTRAFAPLTSTPPVFGMRENPRKRNQLQRARLALQQLEAGLNFYGYTDEAVPTLRYDALLDAAHRWAAGAKSAQNDYLAYLTRVEQADLDMLAAKAQERRARAAVAIAAEQVEIAKAGVVAAGKLVKDVEKLVEKKKQEIEDAKSVFNQFKDYFSGMKSSISSIVDVGKDAKEGATALGITTDAEIKAATKQLGSQALTSSGIAGGLAVVGGFGAFAVLSTMSLQGMADAATKRETELKTLQNEALPAARAAVRVQERMVVIANLQGEIAATDLTYARDLIAYQNERFLNRDFWDALAGVARRSVHRYLDLAAQSAWFAERALTYQLAAPIRIVRLGYFDPRLRDVGGVDRLSLDLAELEAVRLGAARVTVPITRSYSLARDLPLAFGELKSTGRCTFSLSDADLLTAHPGTFAHRVRAVDVRVETPGTVVRPRGILTNRGVSLLRRTPTDEPVPLLRFADAYPVSEFQVRSDLGLYDMPNEQLLPFEGSAFTTTWSLELPLAANPAGLARVTDVVLTFDLQAGYDAGHADADPTPAPVSRALFVSALSVDTKGLSTLRTPDPNAKVRFDLNELPLPRKATITNLAVVLPGVDGGSFGAKLRIGNGPANAFSIDDGIAMSNLGALSDGDPANEQPLNDIVGGPPARPITLEIAKGSAAAKLAAARDVLLWVEYDEVA